MLETPSPERRRRLARPLSLTLLGGALIATPFLNYVLLAWQTGIWSPLPLFLGRLSAIQSLMLILCLPAGFGLLRVRWWGWSLAVLVGSIFVAFNLITYAGNPTLFNLVALTQAALAGSLVYFLVRGDVRSPYITVAERGWRQSHRQPANLPLLIDSVRATAIDLSPSGVYVEGPFDFELGRELTLDIEGMRFQAGVVRIDENGMGLAFRGVNRSLRTQIRAILARIRS